MVPKPESNIPTKDHSLTGICIQQAVLVPLNIPLKQKVPLTPRRRLNWRLCARFVFMGCLGKAYIRAYAALAAALTVGDHAD